MGVGLKEVLEATGGKLVSGPQDATFSHLHVDSREVQPGGLFVALKGEQQDGHAFIQQALDRGAGGILCQAAPPVVESAAVVEVANTRDALFALTAHRLRSRPLPIVAITGSAGKTTTKDLIAHVLGRRLRVRKSEGNLNTNTGVPMTIFELDPGDRVLVVEYAMSKAGEIAELTRIAPPSIGVVLNVGLAHVGLLGSIEAVASAKRELIQGLKADGLAILNADDPRVKGMAAVARRSSLYGFSRDAVVRAEKVRLHGLAGSQFRLKTPRGEAEVYLRLPGQHSISNALATAAVALEFDFDAAGIASALHGFVPPDRRMNVVSGHKGSTIIDDCYNASPGSMRAALEVLRSAPAGVLKVAVLGDMLELGDHSSRAHQELGTLARQTADHLIVMGEFAGEVVAAARSAGLAADRAVIAPDVESALAGVEALLSPKTHVLVKGSRGMKMERIVEGLREE